MLSSESLKEIAPAVAAAQSEFRAVGKSGENKFDRYRYANLDDYVAGVRPVLAAHGLSLLSSVDEVVALEDRRTKNDGIEHAVRVKLTIRVLHKSGEWVEAQAWGEGQDRADKAVYKAITGARKYALASALGLATTDDPEADEDVGQSGRPAASPRGRQEQQSSSASESDPLADVKAFKAELHKAFGTRGFTAAGEKAAVGALIVAMKVDRLDKLTVAQRRQAISQVSDGKADKHKDTKPAPAEAAAA